MKINKLKLQKALEIVKPGLASKEIPMEQATSFAFFNGKVVTYNEEISISHPVEGIEVTGAVRAEELYKLLSKIKKEELELFQEENQLILHSGKAKAGFPIQTKINLPIESIGKIGKWKELPANFLRFLTFTMNSCSHLDSEPILKCIHVNEQGFVESSDGMRISYCKNDQEFPFKTFLILAESAYEIVKLKPNQIAEGKGWIHFKTEEGTILSCRVFDSEDSFPDTSHYLKVEGILITLPRTMSDILDRSKVFNNNWGVSKDNVNIYLKNDKFKIRSESDNGWIEEEANISYEEEPISFHISPSLIKDIIKETSMCIIGSDRIKFNGEDWQYVSLLNSEIE